MNKKKTVIITGGTGGIGAKVAASCKSNGWNVVITGRLNSTRLKSAVQEGICDQGYEWDCLDQRSIHSIAKATATEFGSIDALVNSIGIVDSVPLESVSKDNIYNEFNVNVVGPLYAIQAVVPIMNSQTSVSRIVNVSSLRGVMGLASKRSPLYSASKAALQSLTESVAKTYSPKILVNAVAPGFTLTTMSDNWSDSTWDAANSGTLLQRPAKPEEIASHVLFMISENCSYQTGQTIVVDGGYMINR